MVKPAGLQGGHAVSDACCAFTAGRTAQDQHAFSFERELFAANGYVVLAVNYRGSSGRGAGLPEGDLRRLGKQGSAGPAGRGRSRRRDGRRRLHAARHRRVELRRHPDRLHDRDDDALQGGDERGRERAADDDVRHRPVHLPVRQRSSASRGTNKELYDKLSYPFWQANKIKTPTLFLGGEKDMNVPITGSEQMYMALKSQGIDTQLIVYPNQNHGIALPSYQKDRLRAVPGLVREVPEAAGTTLRKELGADCCRLVTGAGCRS